MQVRADIDCRDVGTPFPSHYVSLGLRRAVATVRPSVMMAPLLRPGQVACYCPWRRACIWNQSGDGNLRVCLLRVNSPRLAQGGRPDIPRRGLPVTGDPLSTCPPADVPERSDNGG